MDEEIAVRITNAWQSFWSLGKYMKGDLPLCLKQKFFNQCILPIMIYGSQVWSLTEAQLKKLKICQRNMERSMIGIKRIDRIRNEVIRNATNVDDVGKKLKLMKWDWAGHLIRYDDNRWSKFVTEWYPREGSRRPGRPYMRWNDELKKFAG